MPRRPLVATLVTAAAGAVLGAALGAVVGRVIALLGDATIQPSVPMTFCATLGYLIGGPAAIKGSLDRFGARRSSQGAGVAAAVVVVLVGGLNIATSLGGLPLFAVAVLATVVAAVAAVAVGKPHNRPVAPAPVGLASRGAADTPGGALAAPFLVTDRGPAPQRPPAASAARRVPTSMVNDFDEEDEDDDDQGDDWSTFFGDDQPASELELPEPDFLPPASESERPRRREPLRAERPAPESEEQSEPESERPRRDRPLRKGDAEA